MPRMTLALVCGLMLAAPATQAEDNPLRVQPGDRVRVTAPTAADKRLVGRAVAVEPAALTLDLDHGGRVAVPTQAITKLELSRGERSKAREGALWGAGFGLVGLTVICLDEQSRSEGWCGAAALSVPVYAGLGALIGLAFKTSRWQEVHSERLSVGVGPTKDGGIAMSVALRF